MANLEKRLDALEQAARPGMPTQWRWIIVENEDAIDQAKAEHIAQHGDIAGAGWIVSYLAPPPPLAEEGSLYDVLAVD